MILTSLKVVCAIEGGYDVKKICLKGKFQLIPSSRLGGVVVTRKKRNEKDCINLYIIFNILLLNVIGEIYLKEREGEREREREHERTKCSIRFE